MYPYVCPSFYLRHTPTGGYWGNGKMLEIEGDELAPRHFNESVWKPTSVSPGIRYSTSFFNDIILFTWWINLLTFLNLLKPSFQSKRCSNAMRDRTGQDKTKLTFKFKLDFQGNLWLAALAILAMYRPNIFWWFFADEPIAIFMKFVLLHLADIH